MIARGTNGGFEFYGTTALREPVETKSSLVQVHLMEIELKGACIKSIKRLNEYLSLPPSLEALELPSY